jgi:aminocarboxymuconate-semialdehyde decarboxylase
MSSNSSGRDGSGSSHPRAIDVHAHVIVPEVYAVAAGHNIFSELPTDPGVTDEMRGKIKDRAGTVLARMSDLTDRIATMDAMGVEVQVLSASLVHQGLEWADAQTSLRLARTTNDWIAKAVTAYPARLMGLGTLPLHVPSLAVGELERCMRDLGLTGVAISTTAGGRELGDPELRPFWAKAEELGAVIFIHPAGNTEQRMLRNRLMITVGQPLEEAYALSSLVYEGVMDRFPKLKIMVAHGGGYLPFYAGRHDNEYRYGRAPQLKGDFSSYLPRFFYDTVLFNPDMLEFLVTKVPAGHVMLASDYPFAEKQPVEYVRRAKRIGKKEQDAILGRNAARLFSISI